MKPKRRPLLLLHQGALGDFVMTFPALARLKLRYGSIHAICHGQHGRLAEALGLLDCCYPAEAAAFATLYSGDLAPRVRDILAISEAMLLLSSSEQLAANVRSVVDIRIYRVDPLPPPVHQIPVYRHLLNCLSALGLISADGGGKLADYAHTEFSGLPQMSKQTGVILVHPGSGSKRKRWPLNRFLALSDMLEAGGLAPKFLIGPAEEEFESCIYRYRQGRHPVIRVESLIDLAAMLRSVTGFIGNDAGVSHLAAFLGLPTVAVFGPADPERWAPVGPHVAIVRPLVDCKPCFELLPENCDGDFPDCLYETHPATVFEAFMNLLAAS